MRIARVTARQFRNFAEFELVAHPDFNLLVGSNGAGKTSILEALFALGRGTSHRDSLQALLRHGASAWRIEGTLSLSSQDLQRLVQLTYRDNHLSVGIDGSSARSFDLVRLLPVTIIDPYQHRLVEEGPALRRRFFDWGVFHVEQNFYPVWRKAERALKQRNALLKSSHVDRSQVKSWNRELSGAGEQVTAYRAGYLDHLAVATQAELQNLLPGENWQFDFIRGWGEQPYAEILESRFERDRKQGHTIEGPHRAELRLRREGRLAKSSISRGQQKLLLFALAVAQARLVGQAMRSYPVLLVDDFTAELSTESQERVTKTLSLYPGQKFVTALEQPAALNMDKRVFHVEHGQLHPLLN